VALIIQHSPSKLTMRYDRIFTAAGYCRWPCFAVLSPAKSRCLMWRRRSIISTYRVT
jgi:hypothetical protein